MRLTETLSVSEDSWRLVESGWDPDRAVAAGSNFMVGNGYLGYRGTSPEQGADQFVALVVTDTYDCADGHWTELTTAPNPLFITARVGGQDLTLAAASAQETSLDMRTGEFGCRFTAGGATVAVERLASYADLHVLAQRWTLIAEEAATVEVDAGIDAEIWSLNGTHLPEISLAAAGDSLTAEGTTVESGVTVAVACRVLVTGADSGEIVTEGQRIVQRNRIEVPAGGELRVDVIAAVVSSNDDPDPRSAALSKVEATAELGYDQVQLESRERWATIWDDIDVRIGGNPIDQAALRFNAYHNRICTPAHTDHLPIGARGLSCQAYQGSAFWDQEVYNLPAFLYTEPEIARNILVYRHKTLDGARRKAARLGYDGAYYAWISGLTGDELCPDFFFEDVLTGRPIRNHFNVWQMHVAPDIVTTIADYVAVTGDTEYLVEHGAEVAFEVARFLRSFVRYNDWKQVYHCIRLLGPDEWHENVDDNAFTNYQVQAALAFAVATYETLVVEHPVALADIVGRIGLSNEEVDGWRRVRDHLLLPEPDADSRLIEQFAGFFALEDVGPDEVRERLLDPQEYWGWPNGVAVHTQVSKQADVAMLLWLHDDKFDAETARANYEYYEPRCSHDSSLSHAAHGMVAARIGEIDRALAHFRATAMVDLLNTNHPVVGGTFIGGIHTAACGGTYQLAAQGFGGLGFAGGELTIDPALPAEWDSLSYPVRWRGNSLRVDVDHSGVNVTAAAGNADAITLRIGASTVTVAPGEQVRS
ncbi:MAG: glycosyl hydrolase family 65 protein [Acidimicrobiia bacterium]|nr:glycosyl hydrolase family 65 protein [Acidimicrobiia bacterium]